MSRVYIGIDINLTGYGVAILTPRKNYITFYKFKKSTRSLPIAVDNWIDVAVDLMDKISTYVPDESDTAIVAIEEPAGMGAGAEYTAAQLNKMVGILMTLTKGAGYARLLPSSNIWKKRVVGKGNATKEEVAIVSSKILLGMEMEDYFGGCHHISDAVALAYYAKLIDTEVLSK